MLLLMSNNTINTSKCIAKKVSFPATVIYSAVQIKTQELNVIGPVNFSVETNVLYLETLVIVAMTVLL